MTTKLKTMRCFWPHVHLGPHQPMQTHTLPLLFCPRLPIHCPVFTERAPPAATLFPVHLPLNEPMQPVSFPPSKTLHPPTPSPTLSILWNFYFCTFLICFTFSHGSDLAPLLTLCPYPSCDPIKCKWLSILSLGWGTFLPLSLSSPPLYSIILFSHVHNTLGYQEIGKHLVKHI